MRFVLLASAALILSGCTTAKTARDYVCGHKEVLKDIIDNGCAIPTLPAPSDEVTPK